MQQPDPKFKAAAKDVAERLGVEFSWLMAIMEFETGGTFSPSQRNAAGSGAVGLIQFMPQTAYSLGTTPDKLVAMNAIEQLQYVEDYFFSGGGLHKVKSLSDLYMCVLWPSAVGKPDSYVLFDKEDTKHPKRYIQNAGLDWNKDGKITKAEAARRVVMLAEKWSS
jgi:hypothetical protein